MSVTALLCGVIKAQAPAILLLHLWSHFKMAPHSSLIICVLDNQTWLSWPQSPHSCQWEKEIKVESTQLPYREPITSHFHWPEPVTWLSTAAGKAGKCSLYSGWPCTQ